MSMIFMIGVHEHRNAGAMYPDHGIIASAAVHRHQIGDLQAAVGL
jgi:hypothetical protein